MINGLDGDRRAPLEGQRHTDPDGQVYDDTDYMSSHTDYLRRSIAAYNASDNWFESSLRRRLEDAEDRFQNRHPAGSKYHSEQYRKKSKLFRPKIRSAIRRMEAAAALAFFSTTEMVKTSAVNPNDPQQVLAAEVHGALINHRLETDMNWFVTCMGGAQQAFKSGCVISKQTWHYKLRKRRFEEQLETGETRITEEEQVVGDRPDVALVPLENFRISPASDWTDPVNSSPYNIHEIPMYVGEVRRRMRKVNPYTGKTDFRELPKGVLEAAVAKDWDSIRAKREEGRLDKYQDSEDFIDYKTVMVFEHIHEDEDGNDEIWYTLGNHIMLSEPRPLSEVYLQDKRPFAMGWCITEAFVNYPNGVGDLIAPVNEEINDLTNLRMDNVRQSILKRYLIRRGANMDARRLVRGVAGSAIYTSDPSRDMKEIETRDVTSGSYNEQDRLNMEADELAGVMTQSTVGSSRALNETVGGMNLLASDSNEVKEYTIRTLSETWVEKVMQQLSALEAAYESDLTLLRVVADNVGTEDDKQENLKQVFRSLTAPVNVRLDVGFNSTNPQRQIERISVGLRTMAEFFPGITAEVDRNEVGKVVFGALGYKDGTRFLPPMEDDPRVTQLQQQVQQLQSIIDGKQVEQQARIEQTKISSEARIRGDMIRSQTQMMIAEMRQNFDQGAMMVRNRLEELDRLINAEKVDHVRKELVLQREALSHQINKDNSEAQRAEMMDLKGDDKAGVVMRDNYGMMPGNSA